MQKILSGFIWHLIIVATLLTMMFAENVSAKELLRTKHKDAKACQLALTVVMLELMQKNWTCDMEGETLTCVNDTTTEDNSTKEIAYCNGSILIRNECEKSLFHSTPLTEIEKQQYMADRHQFYKKSHSETLKESSTSNPTAGKSLFHSTPLTEFEKQRTSNTSPYKKLGDTFEFACTNGSNRLEYAVDITSGDSYGDLKAYGIQRCASEGPIWNKLKGTKGTYTFSTRQF